MLRAITESSFSDNPWEAFPVGKERDSRYSLGHCSSLPISSGQLPSLISTSHELFFLILREYCVSYEAII
jgi:hypothetical protein